MIQRADVKTNQDEADTIATTQAIYIYKAQEEKKKVIVEADDTDAYVLLLHHYLVRGLNIPMIM